MMKNEHVTTAYLAWTSWRRAGLSPDPLAIFRSKQIPHFHLGFGYSSSNLLKFADVVFVCCRLSSCMFIQQQEYEMKSNAGKVNNLLCTEARPRYQDPSVDADSLRWIILFVNPKAHYSLRNSQWHTGDTSLELTHRRRLKNEDSVFRSTFPSHRLENTK